MVVTLRVSCKALYNLKKNNLQTAQYPEEIEAAFFVCLIGKYWTFRAMSR
jgi:hypothetical protein